MLFSALNVRNKGAHRPGRCRLETLEPRNMLSGTPPTVADVNVGSTAWTSDFIDYLEANSLGTDGYSIPVGSSSQLDPLPWHNLDQIRITFSEDVNVQQSDMALSGINTTAYEFADFDYDSATFTATWTLAGNIAGDGLLIDLSGDGLDPVTDLDSNILDGEWTTSSSTYGSGNGTAGGDFEFRLDVLPGDANQSGIVTVADFTTVWFRRGSDTQDANYNALYDMDGSGDIGTNDFMFVLGEIGETSPSGNPAGTTNDAPTTQGFTAVDVDEDAADEVLSLFDAFDDVEDADDDLTYQILSNSNATLFAGTAIDQALGELTLDFADNAYGQADLVIRATDTGGLFVDTTLSVNVNSVNDAPVITNFFGEPGPGNIWIFSGLVTDVDDDPEGWIVDFFGAMDGEQATVEADGTFELVIQLDYETFGNAWVQTEDPHGAESNQPTFFVGVT